MTGTLAASRWLTALRPALSELTDAHWARLGQFEQALCDLQAAYPVAAGLEAAVRSQRLRQIRRGLARSGHLALAVPTGHGGGGHPAILQVLLQFICGYHDVDLRDSSGLGHGRMIAEHATTPVRDRWLPALLAGAVPGIAITEPHGGSKVRATQTAAVPAAGGTWAVTGIKTWISRLTEAALFCVFFTDPGGQLTAAAIDAASPGLARRPITPAGLSGWTWGELHLHAVPIGPADILGEPGQGMHLLGEHFAHYRPLVTATALGAAAGIHDHTAAQLTARRQSGAITDLRDNALITLGRTYAQINAALLAALTAHRLAQAGDPLAHLWGCAAKAHGTDIAYQAASELALLTGAADFTADCRTAKARRDLNALLYADGIHDSLYRSAGRSLTTPAGGPSLTTARPAAAQTDLVHA
jgi:alkylation response protein AidB-like acyl-CoA dehydrogenase